MSAPNTPEHDASDQDDAGLDSLFEAARQTQPAPSASLTDRILADAAAHQPAMAAPVTPAPRGLFATLSEALGGWPTVGGLVTATLAGVYIGVAQPELMGGATTITAEQSEDLLLAEPIDLSDLLPGDVFFFEEG